MVRAFYILFDLISQLYLYRQFNSLDSHEMMPCCSSMTDKDLNDSLKVAQHICTRHPQVELENAIDKHIVTVDSSSIPFTTKHSVTCSQIHMYPASLECTAL